MQANICGRPNLKQREDGDGAWLNKLLIFLTATELK